MKKIIALILAMAMALALVACGGDNTTPDAKDNQTPAAGSTIYVMGPTPDHGWTAQAGAYAQAKCDEITAAGEYKAVYMPASSGEEQVDQVNTIIANGDAAIVVMMALDDSAQAGQEALYAEKIPFISFDRIIEATEAYAVLNASGDNWQCGRGIAYWLQKNGMKPGDTIVTLYGDNGTVCSRRADGFKEFLTGLGGIVQSHHDNTHGIPVGDDGVNLVDLLLTGRGGQVDGLVGTGVGDLLALGLGIGTGLSGPAVVGGGAHHVDGVGTIRGGGVVLGIGLIAAGHQGQGHDQRKDQRNNFFHVTSSIHFFI